MRRPVPVSRLVSLKKPISISELAPLEVAVTMNQNTSRITTRGSLIPQS